MATWQKDRKGETAGCGDGPEDLWENLLDLSHNLYSIHCHSLFIITYHGKGFR
jgi:hypothetical protein